MPHRISVALLCALFVSGAILGTMPSCGTKPVRSGAACCRNETTCPMHQERAACGFNTCQSDSAESSIVVTHRAVLADGTVALDVPQRDRAFESAASHLAWVSVVPLTPPPRVG
ncbi:MAG: hypothetical protein QOC81_3068 [Thermoanaerobaculia bacterium]|jgi:hypothetical protein|nr:hypothetical protein [Thermoanaerobaculia bacterium]